MKKMSLFRTLLLCMACVICMGGLCSAKFIKDDDGNWVEYYRETDRPWNIFFIDTNAIKVYQYEGKKYLDISIPRKEEEYESYWAYKRLVEVTNAKFHIIYDIENCKGTLLEYQNKYANPRRGTNDISTIKTEPNGNLNPIDRNLVAWIERNRPDVMQEIRQYNQQYDAQHPHANVPTGATHGGVNSPVQTSGYGPVQFLPRSESHLLAPTEAGVRFCVGEIPPGGLYCKGRQAYFANSAKHYMIFAMKRDGYSNYNYGDTGCVFDYDKETDTFTVYALVGSTYIPFKRVNIIDKDTIALTYFDYKTDRVFVDSAIYKYTPGPNGWGLDENSDAVIQEWSGVPIGGSLDYDNCVDGFLAFRAHNGDVGYAPNEPFDGIPSGFMRAVMVGVHSEGVNEELAAEASEWYDSISINPQNYPQ